MRIFLVLMTAVLVIIPQGAFAAKSRKDVPLAPLPAKVKAAKKVFIANRGGSDLAYDALYAAVKDWSRYQIVEASSDADVIIEIRYVTEDHGTRVWSTTNPSNGATDVHRRQIVDSQLAVTIFDPTSKEVLWSTVEHLRPALRERNREKRDDQCRAEARQ